MSDQETRMNFFKRKKKLKKVSDLVSKNDDEINSLLDTTKLAATLNLKSTTHKLNYFFDDADIFRVFIFSFDFVDNQTAYICIISVLYLAFYFEGGSERRQGLFLLVQSAKEKDSGLSLHERQLLPLGCEIFSKRHLQHSGSFVRFR